jgi:hypothetical protein
VKGFLRFLENLLTDAQPPPTRQPGRIYRWVCPCGATGQGFDNNQWTVESNADQHFLRKTVGHPLPVVIDQHGDVVSRRLRSPSGSVGRHWGWTE